MRIIKVLGVCMSVLLAIVCRAQEKIYADLSLKYLLHQPAQSSAGRPPLVILLHGYGSNEADLFELKDQLPAGFLVLSVRAPFLVAPNAYQWYPLPGAADVDSRSAALSGSRALLTQFIKQVIRRYRPDPKRIYLVGFSQGAVMCYEVGLSEPGLVTGIAPLSGRILPELREQVQAGDAQLRQLRFFIAHGTADNRIPYSEATNAIAYLKGQGLQPVLRTYRNMGHQISKEEWADLVRWLEE